MATFLSKKSYLLNNIKEVPFKDLWGSKGVFTTIRMVGKPSRLLLYQPHIDNLIISSKKYGIRKNNLKNTITDLIKKNSIFKGSDNLFRIALNKKLISISIRKRPIPKKNFNLLLFKYKRLDPKYKNLYYKKILSKLSKLDPTRFDIALYKNKKLLESGTSNLLFVKNNKIYSPKIDIYKGITFKFFSKKVKINYKDIFVKKLVNYDEILLIGSGKGVVSVSKIENTSWKRKSLKTYKKLFKIYNNEIFYS